MSEDRHGGWPLGGAGALLLLALLCLELAAGARLAAQTVRGRLLEEGVGRAVPGALVVLSDTRGKRINASLTDQAGRFEIAAGAPGSYTLRAERIGFRTTFSSEFRLARDQRMELDLIAPPEAIEVLGVTAEARRRCTVRADQGEQLALVWEEARKALSVASFAREKALYTFDARRYERDLDADDLSVIRERASVQSSFTGRPYVSIPLEELLERGFVRDEGGSTLYAGPDADVLLSEEFGQAYCFRLVPGSDGLIGLAFHPYDRRQRARGINGTLWLDGRTLHLQHLEFSFQGLDHLRGNRSNVGGRVEFLALPSGAWIVSRWWIRMPAITKEITPARGRGGEQIRWLISGFREEGGEVIGIRDRSGATVRVGRLEQGNQARP